MMIIPVSLPITKQSAVLEYNDTYSSIPIVIDNGSYNCRAGFASNTDPHLTFKNVVLKPRFKKDLVLVGNDIVNIETVRNNIKIAFDRNLVTQFEIQEYVFDHVFHKLGITSESVDHPVFVNEPICNPNMCRSQMSELLFECYNIPKVAYYVDALSSYFHDLSIKESSSLDVLKDGLIISFGYHTIHFLPVLHGKIDLAHTKRLNMGGSYCDWYMQRLLQLQYPSHYASIPLSLGEKLFQEQTRVSLDYRPEMLALKDPEKLKASTKILQLPFVKTEDSVVSQQILQKRQYQIQRLKETHRKKQEEKLFKHADQLTKLETIEELVIFGCNAYCQPKNKAETNAAIKRALKVAELKNVQELQESIAHHKEAMKRLECKIEGVDYIPDNQVAKPKANYDLVDVPDEDLDADDLKLKRRQVMLKAGADRREKIRELKEDQRRKTIEGVKQLETKRGDNFLGWLTSLRFKRQSLIESRVQRKNRKLCPGGNAPGTSGSTSKTDRRLNQKHKMRLMTAELTSGAGGTRRGQTGTPTNGDTSRDQNGQSTDQLGVNNIDLVGEDSEESEAEQEQLNQLDSLLAQYDPEFSKDLGGVGLKVKLEEYYKLHLTTEQLRVPEVIFHPELIGCHQAGVTETLACVFSTYSPEIQQVLADNVILTGACSMIPGMRERIEMELRAVRPYQSSLSVSVVSDPQLGSWRGARQFAMGPHFSDACISRKDYTEKGHDYLLEHSLSNIYLPYPIFSSENE